MSGQGIIRVVVVLVFVGGGLVLDAHQGLERHDMIQIPCHLVYIATYKEDDSGRSELRLKKIVRV